MKKNCLIIITCLLAISLTAQNVDVHFIDVGQGDATFIDYGNYEVLIDAGNNKYGTIVCEYIKEYVDGSLDIVVATHPDADHIGGLDTVLKNFSVSTIIDSGKKHSTKTYDDYINAVFNEIGAVFLNDSDMSFSLGEGVTFSVIEIIDDSSDNNENSVITMLDAHGTIFLFTGDLEEHLEKEYLHLFKDINILKVAHHGSKTSTSFDFLNKTKPEFAVISCGNNNRYGHPHNEVLKRLKDFNTTVYRTDEIGTVIFNITQDD